MINQNRVDKHLTKFLKERGVRSFVLIHDSYGVHPNDVPILNEEIRKAYVKIFSKEFTERMDYNTKLLGR